MFIRKFLHFCRKMQKKILLFSGLSGAITVALGAMGAHYLKGKIETGQITIENLQTFETAVRYQMYHTLAIILIALLMNKIQNKLLTISVYCFIIGIFLFSGSLYFLSVKTLVGIENWHWLGPVTPIGGIAFITGWTLFFITFLKQK